MLLRAFEFGKTKIEDRILAPVFVIVVPPFRLIDVEALGFYRGAEHVA